MEIRRLNQASFVFVGLGLILWGCLMNVAATPIYFGDIDGDGSITVRDAAQLVLHLQREQSLDSSRQALADLNDDGALGQDDVGAIIAEVLGIRQPRAIPMTRIRSVDPIDGEVCVASNRETEIEFSVPLAVGTRVSGEELTAKFSGREILSRVHFSEDRRRVILFYLEPLPAGALIEIRLSDPGWLDALGRSLDLDGDGVAGGDFVSRFDTATREPNSLTGMIGRVYSSTRDAEGAALDVPLAGVTIAVEGADSSMSAVTQGDGSFTLSPCPSGSFLLVVDGRTAPVSQYPGGDYYPQVTRRCYAIAGRQDNLLGEGGLTHLPLIDGASMRNISSAGVTDVVPSGRVLESTPNIAGTSLRVAGASLFSDSGTLGGKICVAGVQPERFPVPPSGAGGFELVVAVETDGGSNIDPPAAISMPNLRGLPRLSTTALWRFGLHSGEWEIVGKMIVSGDGLHLESLDGMGVSEPGWYAGAAGVRGSGGLGASPSVNLADVRAEYEAMLLADANAVGLETQLGAATEFNRLTAGAAAQVDQTLRRLYREQITGSEACAQLASVFAIKADWEAAYAGFDPDAVLSDTEDFIDFIGARFTAIDTIFGE